MSSCSSPGSQGIQVPCPQLLFVQAMCSSFWVPSVPKYSVPSLLCFSRLTDKAVKDYSAYRSSLLFWALVDLIYNMFKVRKRPGPNQFQEVWDVCILAQTPLVATFRGSSLALGASPLDG